MQTQDNARATTHRPKAKAAPMKLNADRTKATLAIQSELDAHGVEELIRQLAMLRAQMAPAVPSYPGDGTPTMTHNGPALIMDNPLPDGSVTLRLGSPGLGWTSWRLPAGDVEAVRAALESFQQHRPAAPGSQQH